ncbi:hypothetical protein [Brevibacterium pigmentatum]|nr:hypothetical protein [Brevibacterium pigmentatum]
MVADEVTEALDDTAGPAALQFGVHLLVIRQNSGRRKVAVES